MTGPSRAAGRVLLVGPTEAELAALSGTPGAVAVDPNGLEAAVGDGEVDAVVVGSRVDAPVGLVQRAHRAAPYAAIVVAARAEQLEPVRRAISYAPGVPLDVRVVEVGGPLAEEVAQACAAVAQQRQHRRLVAAVAARATAGPGAPPRPRFEMGALLEHAPLGVLVCDHGGGVLAWNGRAGDLLGLAVTPEALTVEEALPGAGALVAAAEGPAGGAARSQPLVVLPTARGAEVEVSAVTSRLDDGTAVVLLLLVDVTQRRAAERARDRLAGHVALLSRVSESLTSTLDTREALDRLTEALVPGLADWVSVQLADEGGDLAVVAMRHRDTALADVVEQARRLQATAAAAHAPSRRAARDDQPVLLTGLDEQSLAEHVPDPTLRALFLRLGVGTALAVPLPGRDRVLGSMVLVRGPGSTPLSASDTDLAVEAGRRAGVALDNARLYAQQRDLAGELQRSLLTAPPQPDHGHIVVRYVAAAQEAQVGGDWHDAFLQPDGATVLVIGDVVGHDTRAAAGMSQLRGILRGIGYTTGADPAEVLSRVDAAIEGLLIDTTATAVVARLEQAPDDVEHARTWLTWSNAGHPPPLVLDASGRVSVLEGPSGDADLLLGIDPTTPRATARTALSEQSTLLLYTDGLVERRGQSLDEGLGALVDVLEACHGLSLDDLCDTVLRRLVPAAPEDDVALVAVRLHPQGRPRPREAGPNRVPPGVPDPPLPT